MPPVPERNASVWRRFVESRNGLGFLFMLPAAAFLLCFLTYPLGLGVWLGFTDARIGRPGEWIGLENYLWLMDDPVFWLSVFNTLFYTTVASVLKFGLGLWLALLLNRHLPFKNLFRAIILLPWVVPTVLSALAFWWIFDSQFSIISWVLMKWGIISQPINFLGDPWNARWSVIAANVWRGIPFVAISLLAGLQTIPQSLNEAAAIDGATPWQRFTKVTLPLLTPALVSGTVLCWARALGEFGATITFAGSLQGSTRTVPLEVYLLRETDPDGAVALSLVLVLVAAVVVGLLYRPGRQA